MKKCFICDKCGRQFDTEEDCELHEEVCATTFNARLEMLEARLENLEQMVRSMGAPIMPSVPAVPTMPPVPMPQPPMPRTPWESPPIWCCTGGNGAAERKKDDEEWARMMSRAKQGD